MHNFYLLLKIRLDELLRISTTKYEKDEKKRVLGILRHGTMFLLAIVVFFLIFFSSKALAEAGYAKMLPILSYVLGSMITLVVTILKLNETISGNADAEFLMAMPFSTVNQVLVLFFMLYIWNTIYAALVAIPMGIIYGMFMPSSLNFYVYFVIGILLTSLPASGIAALIGIIITVILATTKNANQIKSGLSICFISGILIFVMPLAGTIGNVVWNKSATNSEVLCQELINKIAVNYKLARFYQNGIVDRNSLWTFLFFLLSVIWYTFFLFFLGVSYQELILALRSPMQYRKYEFQKLKKRDVKKALIKREREQFLRSKSYLVSSMTGVLLAVFSSIAFLLKGTDTLESFTALRPYMTGIQRALPAFICFCVGLSGTSYCSYSMEGKRHWIMETIPVDEKQIQKIKRDLNLVITIPMVLVSGAIFSLAVHAGIVHSAIIILIPIIYAFFCAWWGIIIDQKYADYRFESENQVMHQSISFFLGYLPCIIVPLCAWILCIAL